MTFDLSSPYVANEIVLTASAPLPAGYAFVYRIGNEVAYTGENSFLSAPLPAEDVGYMTVAVLNVGFGVTSVTADRIVDARPVLIPGGVTTAAMQVQVTEGQPSFTGTHSTAIAAPGQVFIVGQKNLQDLWVYVVLGDGEWFPVGSTWTYLGGNASGPGVTLLPQSASVQTADVATQNIIAGTDSSYIVANPGTIAVGQKLLFFSMRYGRETYQFATASQLSTGDGNWAGITVGNIRSDWENTTVPLADASGGATTLGAPGLIDSVNIVDATTSGGLIKSINLVKLDTSVANARSVSGTFTLQRNA